LLLGLFLSSTAQSAQASEMSDFTSDFIVSLELAAHAQKRVVDVATDQLGDEVNWDLAIQDFGKGKTQISRYSTSRDPGVKNSVRGMLLAFDVMMRNYAEIVRLHKEIQKARESGAETAKLVELKNRWAGHVDKAWELITEATMSVTQLLVEYSDNGKGTLVLSVEQRDGLISQLDAAFPEAAVGLQTGPSKISAAAAAIRQVLQNFPPKKEESKPKPISYGLTP